MKSLTTDELRKGYVLWRRNYNHSEADAAVLQYLKLDVESPKLSDEFGWISAARRALFLSAADVAEKLGISRGSFTNYEKSEIEGSISLSNLQLVAEAMDCELVYAIRPKSKKLFSAIIWEQIYPEALKHPWVWKCDPKNRAGGLSCIARRTMNNAKFRRQAGWSQRANALESK